MAEPSIWRHLSERRFARRRLLAGATASVSGLALAAGTGCSSSRGRKSGVSQGAAVAPAPTSSATVQARRGGTVVDARFQVLNGRPMDPATDTPISNKMRRLWYQGLLGYDMRTYAIEPEVAQKWEQLDQTSYVFHLQPGVKWHNKPPANGRALTADDAVYALNRARTNDPRFVNRILLDSVDQIQATDAATVKLTAKRPDVVLLTKLGSDGLLLVAPDVVEKASKFATPDETVGTGPFMLKELAAQIGASSVRNPDYWKPGLPYLDAHEYKYFGDAQAAYAALLAGQVDLGDISGDQQKDYLNHLPKGTPPELAKGTSAGSSWLTPNLQTKPFDDPRVNRALRLLVDNDEFVTAWGKVWYPDAEYASVFATSLDKWDFTPDEYKQFIFWKQPKDDAAKEALQLLQAAGFSKDKPLKFEMISPANSGDGFTPASAQLYQAQWRRLGQGAVDAQLKIVDGAQATQIRQQRSFSYGYLANAGAFDDPDAWLTDIFRSNGSRNYTGFKDPEIDALIDKQAATFDNAQRQAVVKTALRTLIDRSPTVFPCRVFYLNGVSARVRNHAPEAVQPYGRQYDQVWLAS
jgi:peptide/nickel transport system substrate-binding protein